MADYTPNLNLYKPNRLDNLDVDVTLSDNFTVIDNEISAFNSTDMLVSTWNIHGGRNKNGEYIDLTLNSRDMLIQGCYHLVGLQELRVNYSASHANSKDPINAIANPLLDFRKFYKAQDMVDEATADYGIGLLSYNGVIKHTQYNLPKGSTDEEQRILSHTEMYIDKKKIHVLNTHVAFEPDATRADQLSYIQQKLTELGNDSFILFGDFNVKSRNEYSTYFSNWQMVNGKDGTWYNTYNVTYSGESAVDNIICSNDFKISDVGMHENAMSDHNVLYAKLSL